MKDQKNLIKAALAVPATIGKTSVEGRAIDRQGYEAVTFAAVIGAGSYSAEAKIAPVLLDSDDGAGFVAVPAHKYLGSLEAVSVEIESDEVRTIGYIGDKRHARLDFEVTGILAADVSLSALAILGHPFQAPAP